MPSPPVAAFLSRVEHLLKSNNATEHSYRPALHQLFSAVLSPAEAINEPHKTKYGAPDFVIQQAQSPIGHAEAKDVGINLAHAITDSDKNNPTTSNGKQLKRYRAALPNLLYTDGLEWHWFVDGEPRLMLPTVIGVWNKTTKKLQSATNAESDLSTLLHQFASHDALTISTPRDLAQRLAQIARWLRDVIVEIFSDQGEQGNLYQQLKAFQTTLLPNLTPPEFADMYAQTLVYGLFAARVAQPAGKTFTRRDAEHLIPKTNPFLRKLFREVTDDDLDDRIAWLVDDCARLLAHTDMAAVMQDFGRATRREDPVVHFYETFLAAYDPKMREARGVYYTPEPVVSYIVRSVDILLKTRFGKPNGLADDQTVILDPATGTATFLHAVVQQIYSTLADQGIAGVWNTYVPQKLLPRLFGFELLMAPYTVAHLKMGLLLGELGYKFGSNERLGIYLTNTLDNTAQAQQQLAFAEFIAAESQLANKVKQDKPVMVILGNPPYSKASYNRSRWIESLMTDYKVTVRQEETQIQGISNDYIKFIRFAQWRIDQTQIGLFSYITGHGYINGPQARDIRASLMNSFSKIYIMNLNGSVRRVSETDNEKDEPIFNIQQGTAILIAVKEALYNDCEVYYADIKGEMKSKFDYLMSQDVNSTNWTRIFPHEPNFFFVPSREESFSISEEYEQYSSLPELFGTGSRQSDKEHFWATGFTSQQDEFAIAFNEGELESKVAQLLNSSSEVEARTYFRLCTTNQWSYHRAKVELTSGHWRNSLSTCSYRPFDLRATAFDRNIVTILRSNVMNHLQRGSNLALISSRVVNDSQYSHVFVSEHPVDKIFISSKTSTNAYVLPLYLYPDPNSSTLFDWDESGMDTPSGRRSNLSPASISDLEQRLNMQFFQDGKGDLQQTFGPEDVFHYIYAIFHNPAYRERYAEFLKIDFPRLPLTSDKELFADLVKKGAALVDLHLLRLPGTSGVGGAGGATILTSPGKQGVNFPMIGNNVVEKIQYNAPLDEAPGYVSINSTQRFTGVDSDTWKMQIGGYQPLDKWLKDRKGRTLSVNDIQHYLRMIIALRETRRIMIEIDKLIPGWPIG